MSNNKNTNKQLGWNVKEPTPSPINNLRNRVSFDKDAFDLLLQQQGIAVKVFRSMYCPRVKSIDGAEHEIDCNNCNGSGFIDVAPICTTALIQNQALEKRQAPEGFVDGNTVAITFLSGIELQYFTKIELIDQHDIYFQRVVRSQGDVDHLQYKAIRVNVVVDAQNRQYYQGTDFTLSPDGHIKWAVNKGPSPEVIYSIHYEAPVQYRAVKAMHANRFAQILDKADGNIKTLKMPEQWMCAKEFLVRRTGVNGTEILQNPIPAYDDGMTEES